MAWIEVHQGLFRHRKLLAFARLLDIPRMSAGGHIISLWLWALDNAPDGDLSSLDASVVAFGAEWEGDPELFMETLINVGFVNEDGTIHDWYEYAGRLIERRKADAERKRIQRTSTGHPREVTGNSAATLPYPTLPNKEPSPKGDVKKTFIDERYIQKKVYEFRDLWTEVEVRDEINAAQGHKGYTNWNDRQRYVSRWLGRNSRNTQEQSNNGRAGATFDNSDAKYARAKLSDTRIPDA